MCAYSQGWLEITPPELSQIESFQKFDSERNGYEIYAWGMDAGFRFSATFAPTAFASVTGEICDYDPFPRYTPLFLGSVAKVSDDPPAVLSIYSSVPGCFFVVPHADLFLDSIASPLTRINIFDLLDYCPAVVAVKPHLPTSTYVHAWDSLYHSNDGGISFQGLSRICNSSTVSACPDFLVFHPQIDGLGFAGGTTRSCESSYLFRTVDNGLTWIPVLDVPVRSLLFDRFFPETMYVASDSGVFRSVDSGQIWLSIKQGGFCSIEAEVSDVNTLYAGSLSGEIWKSSNAGGQWTIFNNSFTNEPVIGLHKIVTTDTIIACATDGVFKVYGSFVVTVNEEPFISTEVQIHQNYPNPFNPSTTIRFSIPGSAEVSLKIFNLLGEEVTTLASGHREAGTHSIQWDATGQPSGVYFYRLSTNDFVQTRKLVLLR